MTLWTVARQAPLSMGFSRQEYWSGLSCPPPGDLPDPGIQTMSPATLGLQAGSLLLSLRGNPGKGIVSGRSRKICRDLLIGRLIQLFLQSCLIPAMCQALRIPNTGQVLAQGTLLVWVEQGNQLGRMKNW